MEMELRKLFVLHWDDDSIVIGASTLTEMALYAVARDDQLILWNNHGLLGLIPPDLLANASQLFRSWKRADSRDTPPIVIIQWGQTVPIQANILEILQKP